MVKTEAPACAKAAGNSYSLHLPLGAPLLDSTIELQCIQMSGRAVAAGGLVGETEQRGPIASSFQMVCQVDGVSGQRETGGRPCQSGNSGGMGIAAGKQTGT